MINLTNLIKTPTNTHIEPRDIFMSLPEKHPSYSYPRDVQTEVWNIWYRNRYNKNNIIKMNTGSGKTVVGLIALQSSLNEGVGPAIYVVPDNYLVKQVCNEAKKLGINVAYDEFNDKGERIKNGEDNFQFRRNKAIFVTNVHKLVNGKSIFGLRSSPTLNVSIGSILIDDVHACLNTIRNQFSLFISKEHQAFSDLMNLMGQSLKNYSEKDYVDIIERSLPTSNIQVPFWIWQKYYKQFYRILVDQYSNESFVMFNLPLISESLSVCNCCISSRGLEISPKANSLNMLTSFEQAKRRIFMSATLSDDSVFFTTFGINESEIKEIITPEKANDLGERLILLPQLLNSSISDEEIKTALVELSKDYNVVVLVPSFERAHFWADAADQVLSSSNNNIEEGVELLKNNVQRGLTVLVNKYDGVDLPDEACRILVIDGIPQVQSEFDKVLKSMCPNDPTIIREQMQKIEQGMGRGVRSNSDYCTVILMGRRLTDTMLSNSELLYFSTATKKQYEISSLIWDKFMEINPNPSIKQIISISELCLKRDLSWRKLSKDTLSSLTYNKDIRIDKHSIILKNAFAASTSQNYLKAFELIENYKNQSRDKDTIGYLMQLMAEYIHFVDQRKAHEILNAANKYNMRLTKPINGYQHQLLRRTASSQAENIVKYIESNDLDQTKYLTRMYAIIEDLVFYDRSAAQFEEALSNLGFLLGFNSSRPEKESNSGPDNLWYVGKNHYFVIECKNNVVTDFISKTDCNQLNGSVVWFKTIYHDQEISHTPIMIHKTHTINRNAFLEQNARIIDYNHLSKLREAVISFAIAISNHSSFRQAEEITIQLNFHSLNIDSFINCYSIPFQVQK